MKFRSMLLALAVIAAGPAFAQQSNLRIGLADDPDALDPHLNRSFVGTSVLISLCDRLLAMDKDYNFLPRLATEWSWSADNMTLNMTLRRGVTFHDGAPFNAEAVKFNIERGMTTASR
jgi:peptide/nickel transport system substrate-binding protein